jgi:UDP-N-acetylglucosamine 2-epimerase (non-hydrolysing)
MKVISVVGARPNFMKVAPLHKAFQKKRPELHSMIVHTGQHFDEKMSDVFFRQLSLPVPDYFLGVGQGSHTELTARIMLAFEPILLREKPDFVIVVGDVTSTLACALTAQRMGIPLAHVEAGLRSFDRSMPEEINRILTDQLSDYLFTTEPSARENLEKENIAGEKIFFTGNCMIDSLVQYEVLTSDPLLPQKWGLEKEAYILMTMHRPSNVDSAEGLQKILNIIRGISDCDLKILFPVHPRTHNRIKEFGMESDFRSCNRLILTEPLGYLDFINLMRYCKLIITDSGGIQEESTFLKKPCITFRKSTERPVTVETGSNTLIPDLDPDMTLEIMRNIIIGRYKKAEIPELWDGKAAERICDVLLSKQ